VKELVIMATMRAGDVVSVVRLNPESRGCIGRRPQAGDVGRVRHVIEENGYVTYIVECQRPDGTEEWLCDFDEGDLELKKGGS
jgi:hypothetical protein